MLVSNHHNVFHHEAASGNIEELRDTVVDDIHSLLRKPVSFAKIGASDLTSDEVARMGRRYRRLLHHGCFHENRGFANELIWKWTEATGKYLGCQFWSLNAKQLFDVEAAKCGELRTLASVEAELCRRHRPKDAKLTHEHVYPIKDMTLWLQDHKEADRYELRNYLDRLCIGCVVLESEHDRKPGTLPNPWLRYSEAGIRLAPNPAWPSAQTLLIEEARLLRGSE